MKKFLLYVFLLTVAYGSLPADMLAAATRVEGQIIVQLMTPLAPQDFLDGFVNLREPGTSLQLHKTLSDRFGIHVFTFDPERVHAEQVLRQLQADPRVRAVQYNYRLDTRNEPNDPEYFRQWGLQAIRAPDAWNFATGGITAQGDDIVVAILDSGYDIDHEDLRENIWINRGEIPGDGIDNDNNTYIDDINGWSFVNDGPVHEVDQHGTSVAGIIAARGNNDLGVTGVNWLSHLMLFDVGFVDDIIASYDYIIEQRRRYNLSDGREGAFVVATNASLGLNETTCEEQPIWGAMYDLLGEVGVLTAAGPSNRDQNVDIVGDMPTTCPSDFLLATLNTNDDDEKHSTSAWGPISIDLGSPGNNSYSTGVDDSYRIFNGNSAAVPHLTGAIALLYALPCPFIAESALAQPSQTALLMREVILEGVDPINALIPYTATGGRLNILNSMLAIEEKCEGQTGPLNILNLYPSPAWQQIRVDFETPDFEAYRFEVFNMLGQRVYFDEVTPSQFSQKVQYIPVNNWMSGVYVLRLSRGDQEATRKFMVMPR